MIYNEKYNSIEVTLDEMCNPLFFDNLYIEAKSHIQYPQYIKIILPEEIMKMEVCNDYSDNYEKEYSETIS